MAENTFVYGDGYSLVQNKVKELKQRFAGEENWSIEEIASWQDFQDKLFTMGMFTQQRVFLLNYEVLNAEKPAPNRLKSLLSGHTNVLIIYSLAKPDKRTQLFKTVNASCTVIEVRALKGAELYNWLLTQAGSLGAEIEPRAAELLIYYAGSNMQTLTNEVQKLSNYDRLITVDNVKKLAVRDLHITIFDLVDSVVQGNTGKALAMVNDLFQRGSGIPYILHMLARQYRMLFRFIFYRQKGYSTGDIQKIMPMHSFAFQKLQKQAIQLSTGQCAQGLHEICEADYAFKTGEMPGLPLVQMLIVKLAKK